MSFDTRFDINTPEGLSSFIRELKRRLGLVKHFATLGDRDTGTSGEAVIDEPGSPGWVRVRLQNDDVPYRKAKSGVLGAYPVFPGMPVVLGYDEKGDLAIEKADHDAMREVGLNPLTLNMGDSRVATTWQTDSLLPLWCGAIGSVDKPSTKIAVNVFRYSDTANEVQEFEGLQTDLAAYIPAATLHRYVAVFLKNDNTLQITTSTAKDIITPLTDVDKQECFDARHDDTKPGWLWRLSDAQTGVTNADKVEDLREWLPTVPIAAILTNQKEPTGFVNRTTSRIDANSWDDATRTFTLQLEGGQTNYVWYRWGKTFVNTANDTFQITDQEGEHYIYYDENGALTESYLPDQTEQLTLFAQTPLVAIVYWDKDNQIAIYLAEERHGITMDGEDHVWKHFQTGTVFLSGLALGNFSVDASGNNDTSSQFSCANGVIRDEDIIINIANGAPQTLSPILYVPVFYKSGAAGNWRREWTEEEWQASTAYALGDRIFEDNSYWEVTVAGTSGVGEPVWSGSPTPGDTIVDNTVTWTNVGTPRAANKTFVGGNHLLAWNEFTGGVWQQTEVGNVKYVLSHIFATNDVRLPVIAIQGQAEYGSKADAQSGAVDEINTLVKTGLPFVEFIPVGTIIYQTATVYTNESKSRIVSTADAEDYVNWIGQDISPASAPDIHNNLSELQGGTPGEYYHLTQAQHAALGSGGLTWNEVVGTTQTAVVNNGYVCNNAALVTVTLPDTAAFGSIVRICGKGAGGWKVAQNAGETIHFGIQDTTTGAGGSLASTNQYDTVELLCTVADTEWTVLTSVGNLVVT
jgi:hypothetical protein